MTPEEILAAVPQQEPFRFIDEILELDGPLVDGQEPVVLGAWAWAGPAGPLTLFSG